MAASSSAQIQSVPVNFLIQQINNQPENDRMRMRLDLFDSQSGALTAIGVLSFCSCYCDSIWDAWPAEVMDPIPGTGTLHFVSNTGGGNQNPAAPQTGVLGISGVQGGIERKSDFNLWLKFLWVDE